LPILHRVAKLPGDRKRAGTVRNGRLVIEVLQATTVKHLDDVRALMRGFVAWHRKRHVADIALIDRYFDATDFEAELAGLPGKYAPPKKGSLLIAYHDGKAAGCVALRDLGQGVAEMKRMFVPENLRGLGIGRALADRIFADAKMAGYTRMRLDTSRHQKEAMQLYTRAGFTRIAPYYELTQDLRDWLVFFERAI
jgi:putative acetyltransferase